VRCGCHASIGCCPLSASLSSCQLPILLIESSHDSLGRCPCGGGAPYCCGGGGPYARQLLHFAQRLLRSPTHLVVSILLWRRRSVVVVLLRWWLSVTLLWRPASCQHSPFALPISHSRGAIVLRRRRAILLLLGRRCTAVRVVVPLSWVVRHGGVGRVRLSGGVCTRVQSRSRG
jgi:hypothetical protein